MIKSLIVHFQWPTLMFLMKLAEARERWMFSGRENCCRIPPADSTVEAWEYCEQSGGAVYEYEEEKAED